MTLSGKVVLHKKFGEGTIVEHSEHSLTVRFGGELKKFNYPMAFETFLSLVDDSENERLFNEIEQRKEEIAAVASSRIEEVLKKVNQSPEKQVIKKATRNPKDGMLLTESCIEKGYMDVSDNVSFERSVDAINCFGKTYKVWQRGGAKHPVEEGVLLWFPKLFENELWDNRISEDDNIIYEKSAIESEVMKHIENTIKKKDFIRIVFARAADDHGDVRYRFLGQYELNVEKSRAEKTLVWERVSTRVKTYASKVVEKDPELEP